MTLALSRLNFRDLGGLRTVDGRLVRSGIIYRSEGPANFSKEHRRELGALEFRCVCDLRSATEREAAPNDWCSSGCHILQLDLNIDPRVSGAEFSESIRSDPSIDNVRRLITQNYILMPAALNPYLAPMADALLMGAVPMIVHCTGGKDRTGVAIALLLSLLGVLREDILADYMRSDVFGQNLRQSGLADEVFRKIIGFVPSESIMKVMNDTHSAFLSAALATVEDQWGSIASYFEAGRVNPRRQDELRAALLEFPPYSSVGC